MKKILLAVFISTSLVISATSFVPMAQAALTNSQISAILGLLSSFGADSSVIANVQASLTGGTTTTGGDQFCYNFTRNLTVGSNGGDVDALYARGRLSREAFSANCCLLVGHLRPQSARRGAWRACQ